MCGIFGLVQYQGDLHQLKSSLNAAELLNHRGPDDSGEYIDEVHFTALVHKRLSIIDLSPAGHQPMKGASGHVIVFNGEIVNYRELRETLTESWVFKTQSDTEVILAAYAKWGEGCVEYLRGMFAFVIYDPKDGSFFCARDRFGIKPFYYIKQKERFVFASEMKALLPFLPNIETDQSVLGEYLTFQYTLEQETLFKGIHQLMPSHTMCLVKDKLSIKRYWDVQYTIDPDLSEADQNDKLRALFEDSMRLHMRSDVPVGTYLSGGIDSSLMTVQAVTHADSFAGSFHGKFLESPDYDESEYARLAANQVNKPLHELVIESSDFIQHIEKLIYHLDTPVAGPGSFPQYMISKLASEHVKVILGGQGGDEIFGGYARYLIAYFEQTIKASIDGTYRDDAFVVTPQSIIPNLVTLKRYKPMLQTFWQEGLFDAMDKRYFRLIDRSVDMQDEVDWRCFDRQAIFDRYSSIFNNTANVSKEAYIDKMTHFDFKCLLPALLQVEDRVSMAHGLESRVPFLDHPLVEWVARVPPTSKFPGGKMKHLLCRVFGDQIPKPIMERADKMGFPVPLKEWFTGDVGDFIRDIFSSEVANTRGFYDPKAVLAGLSSTGQYTRKIWGLLSLELWHRIFHDRQTYYQQMIQP